MRHTQSGFRGTPNFIGDADHGRVPPQCPGESVWRTPEAAVEERDEMDIYTRMGQNSNHLHCQCLQCLLVQIRDIKHSLLGSKPDRANQRD